MEKRTGLSVQVVVYRRKPGKENEILVLGLLKSRPWSSWWQPPRGGIEKNEPPEDAALRETREETGIEKPLVFIDLDYIHHFEWTQMDPESSKQSVTYYTEHSFAVETDREEVTLSEEHIQYRWMAPEEAMKEFRFKGARDAVQKLLEILDKDAPSAQWSTATNYLLK